MYYLGVDPGRDKVGLAIINQNLELITGLVIKSEDFECKIKKLQRKYKYKKIILGNGTYHQKLLIKIKKISLSYEIVDESNSTLAAKQEYWNHNPPRGIKKIIPTSLQIPPKAIDDYAAFIIATRYLRD